MIKFESGYLPNEETIVEQFENYRYNLVKKILDTQ